MHQKYKRDYKQIVTCIRSMKECLHKNQRSANPLEHTHETLNFPQDVVDKIHGLLDVIATTSCANISLSDLSDRPYISVADLEPQLSVPFISFSSLRELYKQVCLSLSSEGKISTRIHFRSRENMLANYFFDYQKIEGDLSSRILVGVSITDFDEFPCELNTMRMRSFLSSKLMVTNPFNAEELVWRSKDNPIIEKQGCGHCRKNDSGVKTKLRSCSGCGVVRYCSREHQKLDWGTHKLTCSK